MRVGRTGKEALGFVGVEYVEAMNAVNYKIYVIVKFGVSMSTLFEQVSDAIRKETKYVTGCDVSRGAFFCHRRQVEKSGTAGSGIYLLRGEKDARE